MGLSCWYVETSSRPVFINGLFCRCLFWCLQSFMFSALNLVWCDLDLNVEATPNIASVFTDRRLWIQPSRGYRRGVFYTGTAGERKKGRKSSFWVHWTSPKLNVAVQADFSLFLSLVNLLAVLNFKCSWGLVWESVTSKHKSCMTKEWAILGLSVCTVWQMKSLI